MEDLWKMRDLGLDELADRAEYERMVKRFREEEERSNRKNLLFGPSILRRPAKKKAE